MLAHALKHKAQSLPPPLSIPLMSTMKAIVFRFFGPRVTSPPSLTSLTIFPTGFTTMTIHLINAVALTAVTVFLVNRAFALYDLVNAATVSEHI